MKMYFLLRATLAFILIGFSVSSASAATQTISFDGGCEALASGGDRTRGREGQITFSDDTWGRYNSCGDGILLGDDGFSPFGFVQADAGVQFDFVGIDLSGSRDISRILGTHSNEFSAYDAMLRNEIQPVSYFEFLTIRGFRGGTLAAQTGWDPNFGSAVDLAGFTNLDRLEFLISPSGNFQGQTHQVSNGTWFACSNLNGRCGEVVYDNLRLNILAPVPLPAGGLLLLGAIGGLAAIRRRRR